MEMILQLYLILGIFTTFILVLVVLIIAGRDIFFAFFRRFTTKWNDVFIVNPNRQISHYYKKSEDGVFKVDKKMYITNPEKLLGLSDDMIKDIREKMSLGRKKIENRIAKFNKKKENIEKKIRMLADVPENVTALDTLNLLVQEIDNKIETLQGKLQEREKGYYFRKRGAYFYIEGDPIPKDFYEFFTELDSVQLENVIIRAQTKDPKAIANLEKQIVWLKRFIIFCLIAGAIAGFFAFRNNAMLQEIAKNLGVQISL